MTRPGSAGEPRRRARSYTQPRETSPTRESIFRAAAQKLHQDFVALSTVPHRGLKGDEAARLVRAFLNDHLPKRFAAGSGFIIDQRDAISKQTDVVIYDALNCPVYRASDEAAIFPADNVAAIVEVKSRLDGPKFVEAAQNIAAAKKLAKTPPPSLPLPVMLNTQTLGCVFAFESVSLDTVEDRYRATFADGIGHHVDMILVHDRAVMTLAARPPGAAPGYWAPAFVESFPPGTEGTHVAIARQEIGEQSLDSFLRLLLAQLAYFRGMVDLPAPRWTPKTGQLWTPENRPVR